MKKHIELLCETNNMENYGEDKEIFITTSDDYTHAIIINIATPIFLKKIEKKNVIGLAYEPPIFLGLSNKFIEYAKQNINKYFIGSNKGLPLPFLENYSYMCALTPPIENIPMKKTKFMSIIISKKIYTEGHKYRHLLTKTILSTNLPIDIYGHGSTNYNDSRIKGPFSDEEINEPYRDYQYHICIENVQIPCYVSEKILNALTWNTIPIYLGATNIDNEIEKSTIRLSGNIVEDMTLLYNIYKNPTNYIKDISQTKIRNKMNILRNLDEIFG